MHQVTLDLRLFLQFQHVYLLCKLILISDSKGNAFLHIYKSTGGKKETKLCEAFTKIASRVVDMKWMFRCIRNYYVFVDLYDTLDLVCNIHSFANLLLGDNDIETQPACYSHKHSISGLDFLVHGS